MRSSNTLSIVWQPPCPIAFRRTVLLREIRALGYSGGISQLKAFVHGLVPVPMTEPVDVLERNTHGRGAHRFHPGFLDFVKHAGALPRLCQPYRAQTKGKVERFIGYLKRSFWVPFSATVRQAGLMPDKHAANAAVARWLREVANARVHATTHEVPAERLIVERSKLQTLPAVYAGRSTRALAPPRKPVVGYQHPLSMYDDLCADAVCASEATGKINAGGVA